MLYLHAILIFSISIQNLNKNERTKSMYTGIDGSDIVAFGRNEVDLPMPLGFINRILRDSYSKEV